MSYKITDLSALTTPATGDLVPIVDVSDTTQSADGSTKKITYANLGSRILTELGVTSSVAELNILDGVAATAAELNILEGVTSNATELNLLDGKTLAGLDNKILTGTPGTSGDLAQWNADGDLVDSATPPSGDIVGTSDTQTLSNKRVTKKSGTVASSATPTINTDSVDIFTITALATNITSMTTNLSGTPTLGQTLIIRILDNGTSRTITWGASFASRGADLPTATTISKYLYVGLIWNTVTSTWDCIAAVEET